MDGLFIFLDSLPVCGKMLQRDRVTMQGTELQLLVRFMCPMLSHNVHIVLQLW